MSFIVRIQTKVIMISTNTKLCLFLVISGRAVGAVHQVTGTVILCNLALASSCVLVGPKLIVTAPDGLLIFSGEE